MATSMLQERLTDQEAVAVLWAAADKAADKELDRDSLPTSDSRKVRLMITGEVDGHTIHRSLHGTLKVGADQERAVSATPDQGTLIALILSKLNKPTRDKILADLPRQFAELGERWPDVSPDLVESAEQMLRDIRSQKIIRVRGNVRFNYDLGKQTSRPTGRPGPTHDRHRPAKPRCHETRRCTE